MVIAVTIITVKTITVTAVTMVTVIMATVITVTITTMEFECTRVMGFRTGAITVDTTRSTDRITVAMATARIITAAELACISVFN